MSVRQDIVDAIATRLGTIASGQTFTLPDGVYTCGSSPLTVTPWRRVPYAANQVPAIAFWDTVTTIGEGGPIGHHEHRLEIQVVGFVAGKDAVDEARLILQDIIAAVGSDPQWGGLAHWTEISDQTLQVEESADVIAGCELKLTVIYRTRLWRS